MASEPYAGTADPPGYVDLAAGAEYISEYPGEKWCKAPVVAHTRISFDCRYGKSDERCQQKFLPFQ